MKCTTIAVAAVLFGVGCGGPMRNAPVAPLASHPVEPAFARFWSSALSTTVSLGSDGANERTRTLLVGPSARLALGTIEDGVVKGQVAHAMQFLLLPAEVVDVAVVNDRVCTLRTDAKILCAQGKTKTEIAVVPDGARLLPLLEDRMCVLRKGGGWACYAEHFDKWALSENDSNGLERFGKAISVVPDSHCFITADKKLICFERRDISLSQGDVIASDVVHASVGTGFGDYGGGCAAHSDGTVRCWGGMNDTGVFGDGERGPHDAAPVKGVADAIEVGRSPDHACALTRAHAVYCWGSADGYAFGEAALSSAAKYRICDEGESGGKGNCVLGEALKGHQKNHLVLTPVRVPELEGIVSLAVGYERTCGIRTDGKLLCLGGGHPGAWTVIDH